MRVPRNSVSVLILLFCFLVASPITSFAPNHRTQTTEHSFSSVLSGFQFNRWCLAQFKTRRRICLYVERSKAETETIDDESLLNTVSLEQLIQLCDQCQIPNNGSKMDLLLRLRNHAATEAEKNQQRYLARRERVENAGSSDDVSSRERYEIVTDRFGYNDTSDLDDDNGYFYFELPEISEDLKQKQERDRAIAKGTEASRQAFTTRDQVTAPPPPVEANADGERVVTVYSTTELNDLTSIAAAQPGRGMSLDALGSNACSLETQPWDYRSQTSEATTQQFEKSREKITELVSTLLSMSGAPAYSSMVDEHDDDARIPYVEASQDYFVGFNPASVPVELLTASSQALRIGRGEVLHEVLRQFELQAIGQDGLAGDNKRKGGGHYREVMKVRAFLEGYRRAEVRRLARETTALLLDKLVLEGIDGLDSSLRAMVRSSDDTDDYAGTLNDSLIDFLSDTIRQKEKEIESRFNYGPRLPVKQNVTIADVEDDLIEKFWNVTVVNGQRIETFNPNDSEVKNILQAEVVKSSEEMMKQSNLLPETAPEKLLLLLKLLRERIKAEAAFSSTGKGQYLRLLAYCLRLSSNVEREQLLVKHIGNSLDVSVVCES